MTTKQFLPNQSPHVELQPEVGGTEEFLHRNATEILQLHLYTQHTSNSSSRFTPEEQPGRKSIRLV